MKRISLILLLAVIFLLPLSVEAAEEIPIYTPQDLLAISEAPADSYILMNDLDMSGIPWKSLDFSGTLDGNGHAILNLTLSEPSDSTPEAMDGNNKKYAATYVGMFGALVDAEIKNLKLLNVRALVTSDSPVFLASLAGYSKDSTITNCSITSTLELRAHEGMYGVGGVIGYGSGKVDHCQIDVTLICTDTDADRSQEQFMGGVFAAGFVDVLDSSIHIQGYCSEFGYVHNGGIGGLYMQYPLAMTRPGYVTGNHVSGGITFFEKSKSQRAYCSAYCGEIMSHNYHIRDNTNEFVRDERKEYDTELRPEMCPDPQYQQTLVPSGCSDGRYGYTEYTCTSCGYTYQDHYTALQHQVSSWTQTVAATTEKEGLSTGNCDECGLPQERIDPVLLEAPVETTPPTQAAPELLPVDEAPVNGKSSGLILLAINVVLLTVVSVILLLKKRRNPYR